ncbi:MAG: TetR/AcrR family transcriptional regulator [Thermoguttaceae bacterium]|nr:TetR/AcrR family transcriptional regulator [Thermoguttaceae bacterium]
MNAEELHELPTFIQPPTARGQARWRKVVETAKRLFEERGYNEVSFAEIVREAGGSLTTVYRWFGNKNDLFLCVVLDHISRVPKMIDLIKLSGPTARADVEAVVEKLVVNVPFNVARGVFLETRIFSKYQSKMLDLIEQNTNVPIASLFGRIRRERGVEFVVSDEELALTLTRFFRGLFLEVALDETQKEQRLEHGKRLIAAVLISLIRTPEGAR